MHFVLAPAVALMNRLRFPVKTALIGLLFLAPLAVVMYFFQREINHNIEFARVERQGVTYVRPVNALMGDVLQHEQAVNRLCLKLNNSSEDVLHLQDRIAQDVEAVDAVDRSLGAALRTTPDWSKLKAEWENLKKTCQAGNAQQALDAHTAFLAHITAFITLVGTNSNLILDPDIDTYYTMDTLLTQMPQVAVNVCQARDQAVGAAERSAITADEKTQLTVLTGQITTPRDAVAADLQQAIAYNASVKPQIGAAADGFQGATGRFVELIKKQFVDAKRIGIPTSVVSEAGNGAIEAGMDYHRTGLGILDDLLARRLRTFVVRRNLVDAVAALFLLLAAYAFAAFYRSTLANVSHLLKTVRRLAEGDLNCPIEMRTRDEIGQMAIKNLQETKASLREMAEVVERIAAGDLTANVAARSKHDILGRSVMVMTDNLRRLIGQVASNADLVSATSANLSISAQHTDQAANDIALSILEVSGAADQSAQASQEMAQGSEQQARAAADAVNAMEQLQRSIFRVHKGSQEQRDATQAANDEMAQAMAAMEENIRIAQAVGQAAGETEALAQNGAQAVQDTIANMARIQENVKTAAEHVKALGQMGQQIGAIVGTIDQIAEQTNLLALNAAIEAARAGEHGRGFAVVADEVRKLADRATRATREIASLIQKVRADVETTVQVIEVSDAAVEEGVGVSHRTADALAQIQSGSETVKRLMAIALPSVDSVTRSLSRVQNELTNVRRGSEDNLQAAGDMATNSGQVSNDITKVASVSEAAAAGAEEMSASSEEVSASAQNVSAALEEQRASIHEVTAAANELKGMAERLQEMVRQFRLDDGQSLADRVTEDDNAPQSLRLVHGKHSKAA